MDLVSGRLLWPDKYEKSPTYESLQKNINCEVVVVGGGQAGALHAHSLIEKDIDTVLVEQSKIGSGSTSANTGILQFCNDKSLTSCINSFGLENGLNFYKLCKKALDDLEEISTSLPSNFQRKDSLYFASDEADLKELVQEYEALKKHGFPVRFLSQEDIEERFSFSKPGAILSSDDAEINPYQCAHDIIKATKLKGLKVFEQTKVQHIKHENNKVRLMTNTGYTIIAEKVVFTTGYETQKLKRNRNAILSSTYTIATNNIDDRYFEGWYNRCLIWETARPYLYIRTTNDNRIVCGGLDEDTANPAKRDGKLHSKGPALLAEIQNLFPSIKDLRVDYAWAGMFGSTHDGLPFIGTQPEFPNCYFSLGYGGNGTIYSVFSSEIIADLITKGNHPLSHLFSFDR
jgi:glycine/D-amino acid oxidase-like deaminating enzyme